jgi:hypothetical protein
MNEIELPWSFYNMHGLEFNGQISFLKSGSITPIILRRSARPTRVK